MNNVIRNKKGIVLITVIIFMVILFMLSGAITTLVFPEFFFLKKHSAEIAAFHLADAGIKEAMYRMEQNKDFSNFTGTLAPAWPPNSPAYGTYSVTIAPDPGNNNDIVQIYYITSVARLNNRPGTNHTVYAIVDTSTSFAKYLYFSDQEIMAGSGTHNVFNMGDQLNGPVFSNDQFYINWTNYQGNPPIFQTKLDSARTSINYIPDAPQNESGYKKIFKNGSQGFELGVGKITFPPPNNAQITAALGGMQTPTSQGVYLPNNGSSVSGGIYVMGDLENLNFKVDGNGNQTIEFYQEEEHGHATRKTTVTLNPASNTTTIQYNWKGQTATYQGIINGVIFTNGDVGVASVGGTIGSRLTLVTPPNNEVEIKGHIRYKDDPRTNPNATNVLGIVSGNIIIDDNAPANLEVDAVMLAGNPSGNGSFYYGNWDRRGPKGNLTIFGGLATQQSGPVGTYNPDGSVITGYKKIYNYDTRLSLFPPPYYPTTGKLRIRFWKDLK
ncbi:MAG: hypothetical protein M1536_09295 [Firmicutes bacterium]|nr:hypothetical protein [Bacillota bacterium]